MNTAKVSTLPDVLLSHTGPANEARPTPPTPLALGLDSSAVLRHPASSARSSRSRSEGRSSPRSTRGWVRSADRRPTAALRHASAALDHAGALGMSYEYLRWAWPLAARAAHDLADTITARELLAMLDGYQPGQLAPMQRAERDLVRARLAAANRDPDAAGLPFAAAIAGLRQHSTPPPSPWPARPRRLPRCPQRNRGRDGRDRRGPRCRRAAGLPAATGPGGNHPARQTPYHDLVTTASPSAAQPTRARCT